MKPLSKYTIEALEHKLFVAEDEAGNRDDPETAQEWVPVRDQLRAALAASTLERFPLAIEELENHLGMDDCLNNNGTLTAEGRAIFDDTARAGHQKEYDPRSVTYAGGKIIKPRTRMVDGTRYLV